MNRNIMAAIIVAAGLVAAAFLYSGRYYVLVLESGSAIRVDRWTGQTKMICTASSRAACDDADWETVTPAVANGLNAPANSN